MTQQSPTMSTSCFPSVRKYRCVDRHNQYIRGLSRALLVQLICTTLSTFGGWSTSWYMKNCVNQQEKNIWRCEKKKLGNRGRREEENHGSTGTDTSNEVNTHSIIWRKTISSWFIKGQRTIVYHASQCENDPASGYTHVFHRRPTDDSKQLIEVGHRDSPVSKIELA